MEKEQIVEIDDATAEAIAKHVKAPEIDLDDLAAKLTEKIKPADKEINKLADGKKKAVEGEVVDQYSKMSKEAFAVAQVSAALSGNSVELSKLNEVAIKSLVEKELVTKATYLNAGTSADGGVLVPNAELLSDIFDALPTYSPLANVLRVINLTTGDSLDVSSITADVVMTEVGTEGGSKSTTKPTLGDTIISVREFAGIAILTKKLLMQSAVDVYAVLRDSFARAIAKNREKLILSDSTSGIIGKSGVAVTTLASGNTKVAKITWAQVKAMPFAVPTASANGGIYVFSRLLAASIDGMQDSNGRDLDLLKWDNGGLTGTTKNGYPFVVAESLGTSDAASTTHAVFGNFGQYGVVLRQGAVDSAVFDSGTVEDSSSVTHNLIQENKLAQRVESWENVGYPIPSAFATIATSAS